MKIDKKDVKENLFQVKYNDHKLFTVVQIDQMRPIVIIRILKLNTSLYFIKCEIIGSFRFIFLEVKFFTISNKDDIFLHLFMIKNDTNLFIAYNNNAEMEISIIQYSTKEQIGTSDILCFCPKIGNNVLGAYIMYITCNI